MASPAQKITEHFGGDWHGSYGCFPTPGHSKSDRGMTVTDKAGAPDGVLINTMNGGDPLALKDECRRLGLLPEREFLISQQNASKSNGASRETGHYVYETAPGTPAYRMVRKERPGERKQFLAQRPDGKGGWIAGIKGLDRILYRLPPIKQAIGQAALKDKPLPLIYLFEGERKADKAASWGLLATAVAFGAEGWRDAYAADLAGCTVAIVPDNDDQGRKFADKAAASISAAGGRAVIVPLPRLANSGDDIMDWDGTADELRELTAKALMGEAPDTAEQLPCVDAGDFDGVEVPPREWEAEGWEPRRSCVLVTGLGASGKSLLYQQRATCSAVGANFLGVTVRTAVAVYVTCEDDISELHRRQKAINDALGITWQDLRGKLFLVSLKGMQNNELCTFDQAGRMQTTPRWRSLLALVHKVGAGTVILDNTAHLFAGNEIVRNQVAAFIGLLDRLAVEINGGVILLGHPNKDGAEYSGSTAWENQVRSRVYLSLAEPDAAGAVNPDARRLTNSKPNYSRRGASIDFLWDQWAFVLPSDIPPNRAAEMSATIQATAENSRFLECLDKTVGEKRAVSLSPSAANYAPRVFVKMPTAKGLRVPAFEAAMQRLLHLGTIAGDQPIFQRANRQWVRGLGRAPTLAPTMHQPPAPTRTEVAPEAAEILHQGARATDPYTYGNKGAAHEAAAPSSGEEAEPALAAEALDLSRVIFGPLPIDRRDPFNPADWPEDEQ